MDFGFSPSRGGTLHLSPTSHHKHHSLDPLGAIAEIRRSMSRSPSKRTASATRSGPQTPRTPKSPKHPQSPLRFPVFALDPADENTDAQSPATARKLRPGLRRSQPIRFNQSTTNFSRPVVRVSPRRGLKDSSDNGNSGAKSAFLFEHDNFSRTDMSTTPKSTPPSSWTPHAQLQTAPPVTRTMPPMGLFAPPEVESVVKSSPLKRSDGSLNLEESAFASPSTKRRSLNDGTFELSRETLDQMAKEKEAAESSDEEMGEGQHSRNARSPPRLGTPRRSTAQTRPLFRSSSTRNRRSLEMGSETPVFSRSKRSSLDSAVPVKLFHSPKPTSTEQDVGLSFAARSQFARSVRQGPHPLSKALSPASPSPEVEARVLSSPVFESPQAPRHTFAKSLPLGAERPQANNVARLFPEIPSEPDFATPNIFKTIRPDPAAFQSTGLISKKHRNADDMPPPPTGKQMPDTPIKKSNMTFGFTPSPAPSKFLPIPGPKFQQPNFGAPTKPTATPFAASSSVSNPFGSAASNDRRASMISMDGDELSRSPSGRAGSQSSSDDFPPTPTKAGSAQGKPNSLRSSLFGRRPSLQANTFVDPASQEGTEADANGTAIGTQSSSGNSPHTPAEAGIPDPSNLSISPRFNHISKSPCGSRISDFSAVPETPSAHRQTTTFLREHHLMLTPSTHAPKAEVDPEITNRFKRAEFYGRGAFSEVFKVYQAADWNSSSYFTAGGASASLVSMTPKADRVFIIKKTKAPYGSKKNRERAIREVDVMTALSGNEHIVQLLDSWEAKNHLYMQMEFCEEGSLSFFLETQGRKGRLDDFRIWKILIELSQGVQHIHASGFIHLDLKPENVFIDFSGMLKIGDFGMASVWPAPPHIEGEGDRRYMGPETLQGKFDKPADIFALGMIMFEIAGNCEVPDNGASWQQLRSGDFSGLPSLTSASTQSLLHNDSDPMVTSRSLDNVIDGPRRSDRFSSPPFDMDSMDEDWGSASHASHQLPGTEEPVQPPTFMLESEDVSSLDHLVQQMMLPEYQARPTIEQILQAHGCLWVAERRRSGATVFEGLYGPPNHILKDRDPDSEMLDV